MSSIRFSRFAANGGIVWTVVVLILVYALTNSADFRSPANLTNLSRQMIVLGLVSLGQFVVVLVRGVDLSIGANVRIAAIVAAIFMDGSDGRFVLGAALAISVSLLVGVANGVAVVALKVEPFIATLATNAVVSGLALYLARTPRGRASPFWTDLYTQQIGPIPVLVIMAAVVTFLVWVLLARMPWGRHIYAVGGDPEVARVSGLRVNRIAISAYVLAGGLAGLAGLVVIGSTGVGDASAAASLEFESLAVVVIGGASLAGGRGRLIGVLGGVVLFGMLGNVFNLLDVEVWYQQLVRGAVILIAAAAYSQRRSKPRSRSRPGLSGSDVNASPPDSPILNNQGAKHDEHF